MDAFRQWTEPPVRIGVVLSAGGLRGVAHLGVMQALLRAGVPIDVLVGVSAGAIVAGFYAGVGLTIADMVEDAVVFKGRHVFMHALTLRMPPPLRPLLRGWCGVIPRRLALLDQRGAFAALHHGVSALGIVCHDTVSDQPVYFSSRQHHGAHLSQVVKASAAVPRLMPTRPVTREGRRVHLVDGGISDSLPTAFAASLDATHLVVSDCRSRVDARPAADSRVVYIRPDLRDAEPWRSPSGTLLDHVRAGREAVTDEALATVRSWVTPVAGVSRLVRS